MQAYLDVVEGIAARPLPERYNIAHVACDRWADDPDRIAMLVPDGDTLHRVSFRRLALRSSRFADALEGLGTARGDRVAVCLPQSEACAVSHLAIERLGAVAVPISTLTGSDGVRHRVEDAGAHVIVARHDTHAWLADLAPAVVVVWVEGPSEEADFAALSQETGEIRPPVDTALDDPALIIYTSGTTGMPKGALHAHRVVAAHADAVALIQTDFPQDGDVLWSPADWAWGGGLIDCLYASLEAGRPIVAWRPRKFDGGEVLDTMARCGVTNVFLPPTAIKMLSEASDLDARLARLSLRAVMTGGERVSVDISTWCEQRLGLRPHAVYGQTEVSCVVGHTEALPPRDGSIGMELPRARVAVLRGDGSEADADEVGELALHRDTAAMFLGYWRQGSVEPPVGEWHRTGDLGRRDVDGYLWHHGRADDVILTSGYRVGPGEIEDCLAGDPRVAAVAVIGEPDELRGEVITAVLQLASGTPGAELEQQLQDRVRTRLAAYEVPRRFRYLDELPRTETGKVRRAALRTP